MVAFLVLKSPQRVCKESRLARYAENMLSVERVKELINDPNISDKEIEEIRDGFYLLSEVIFEQWQAERLKAKKEKLEVKSVNQNENEKSSEQRQ